MSKRYIIEKKYEEKEEERRIYVRLENIRKNNLDTTFTGEISGIWKKWGILMKKPDSGCLLELTEFYRDGKDIGKIKAVITAVKDDKPEVVETLEKLLEQTAKVISLKSIPI